MKKIAFFMSAVEIDRKYADPALELVRLTVAEGYTFMYGGSDWGLMKEAADEVTKMKGTMIGISCEEFRHVLRTDCTETFVTKNIAERKAMFIEKADALVALPGGAGTLDEIVSSIGAKKLNLITSPIVLLNIDHFWDGLIMQCKRMCDDGFINKKLEELIFVSDDPHIIMDYLSTAFTSSP